MSESTSTPSAPAPAKTRGLLKKAAIARSKGPAPAAEGHEHDLDDLQDAGLESEAR